MRRTKAVQRTIDQRVDEHFAEQMTGCPGAGDYRRWAVRQGYTHCDTLDWTSSAGDWQFIVSKNGKEWFILTQENNYPRGPGFTRTIDDFPYWGRPNRCSNKSKPCTAERSQDA